MYSDLRPPYFSTNYISLPQKNAQIKASKIDDLMAQVPVPEIKLLASDVQNADQFKDVLETFNCMICFNIPIDPIECSKCDVLFCKKCIEKYKTAASYSSSRKCPKCREMLETRPMNRKLKEMTLETLKFEHRCIPDTATKKDENEGKTPLEIFKKSAAYREILKKQGKPLPPEISEP